MSLRGTGLWLPDEIMEIRDLNMNDKAVLAKIVSLDAHNKCWMSNPAIGEFLGISRQAASQIITKLRDRRYINVATEHGAKGKVVKRYLSPNGELSTRIDKSKQAMSTGIDEMSTPVDEPREVVNVASQGVKRKKKELEKKDTSLFKWIMAGCEKVHKGPFKNYGQQGKATNQLLKTAEKMAPKEGMTVKEWVETYMHLAFKMWEADEFWHKQAFSPSLVNGSAFFDKVMMTAKENSEAGLEDLAKEMFK